MSWQRAFYYLNLTLIEVTPLALLLTLFGGHSWLALMLVLWCGAVGEWLLERFVLEALHRYFRLGLGILAALWAAKQAAGLGVGLLSGWGALFELLFSFGTTTGTFLPYLTLLVGFYAFWRGTRVQERMGTMLSQFFWRALVAMVLLIALSGMFGLIDEARGQQAATQILVYFAAGLLTIALGRGDESAGGVSRIGWRGVLTLVGAVVLVLIGGVLAAALFSEQAAYVVRLVIGTLVAIVGLVLSPFLFLISGLLTWLLQQANLEQLSNGYDQLPVFDPDQFAGSQDSLNALPPWLNVALRIFCAVVPLLLVITLLLLRRRRSTRELNRDEERESLWSWGGFGDDLRDLLNGLLRRGGDANGGLSAALASLRGSDAASRVRRSYIHLLQLGERRDLSRQPQQTPREYQPLVAADLQPATAAITELTANYERARYYPDSLRPADADAAERDWTAIDTAARAAERKRT